MTRGAPTNSLSAWFFSTCSAVCASVTSVEATQAAPLAAVSSGSQPSTYEARKASASSCADGSAPRALGIGGDRERPGRRGGQGLAEERAAVGRWARLGHHRLSGRKDG